MHDIVIHRSKDRGAADHGWLQARHSFSFADYYDAQRMGFGALRVLNDDTIQPSAGFGMHPHNNMEIITIPLSGALRHRDNMGNEGVIGQHEVQVMSAGTGILHAEFNDSREEILRLLQIWILPERTGVAPRYDQAAFEPDASRNQWVQMVGPMDDSGNGSHLRIHQQAWLSMASMEKDASLDYSMRRSGNGAYIFVIEGAVRFGDMRLDRRDAVGVTADEPLMISAMEDARILLLDVPVRGQ